MFDIYEPYLNLLAVMYHLLLPRFQYVGIGGNGKYYIHSVSSSEFNVGLSCSTDTLRVLRITNPLGHQSFDLL